MRKLILLLAASALWPLAAHAQDQQDQPHRHRGGEQAQTEREPRPERPQGGDRQGRWGGGSPAMQAEAPRPAPAPEARPQGEFQRRQLPPELQAQQGWGMRDRQPNRAQPAPQQANPQAWDDRMTGQPAQQWQRRREGSRDPGQARPDGQWQNRQGQWQGQRDGQWQNRQGQWQGHRDGQWQRGPMPIPNGGRIIVSRNRDHDWGRNWRQDRRYDWRDYRSTNRFVFRLGNYYDPYAYQYRRWQVGFQLWPAYYQQDYWLDDPWMYRLPPAYGPYRWVRYWDDALLVNIYTGQVVDVIYDVFW
ncbi:RcnB family protein [Sphingomonas sp. ASV193]|uniref:RcnB family protein n=1 Tax=Sphingomonas sp. ASV193 TaxID=3144405 RepID=UPI0032E9278E